MSLRCPACRESAPMLLQVTLRGCQCSLPAPPPMCLPCCRASLEFYAGVLLGSGAINKPDAGVLVAIVAGPPEPGAEWSWSNVEHAWEGIEDPDGWERCATCGLERCPNRINTGFSYRGTVVFGLGQDEPHCLRHSR